MGCRGCHKAHASSEKNLLTEAPEKLCLSCHDTGKKDFEKAHGGYPVQDKTCLVCHDPHSSDQANLLKGSVHNPVAEAGCDGCHVAANSKDPFALVASGSDLCLGCHDNSELMSGGSYNFV